MTSLIHTATHSSLEEGKKERRWLSSPSCSSQVAHGCYNSTNWLWLPRNRTPIEYSQSALYISHCLSPSSACFCKPQHVSSVSCCGEGRHQSQTHWLCILLVTLTHWGENPAGDLWVVSDHFLHPERCKWSRVAQRICPKVLIVASSPLWNNVAPKLKRLNTIWFPTSFIHLLFVNK